MRSAGALECRGEAHPGLERDDEQVDQLGKLELDLLGPPPRARLEKEHGRDPADRPAVYAATITARNGAQTRSRRP